MIILSRVNKCQHEYIKTYLPKFINIYFRKYYRGKSFLDEERGRKSFRQLDQPFILNERIINLYKINGGHISDENERILVTDFMEKVTVNNNLVIINNNYKDHIVYNGAESLIMITNTGMSYFLSRSWSI